jgi:hypothetical protein
MESDKLSTRSSVGSTCNLDCAAPRVNLADLDINNSCDLVWVFQAFVVNTLLYLYLVLTRAAFLSQLDCRLELNSKTLNDNKTSPLAAALLPILTSSPSNSRYIKAHKYRLLITGAKEAIQTSEIYA